MSKSDGQTDADSRRVGLIIPAINTVIEPELYGARCSNVSFHFSRALLESDDENDLDSFRSDALRCAAELHAANVGTAVLACTATSLAAGVAADDELCTQIVGVGIPAAVTTAGAIALELQRLHVRRCAFVAPYEDWLMEAAAKYYGDLGISVVGHANIERTPREQALVTEDELRELVRRGDKRDVDAIVLSCTNMPTLGAIASLQREVGKPLVSSNAAILQIATRGLTRRTRQAKRPQEN